MKKCSVTAGCLYFKLFINRKPALRPLSTRALLRTSWHFTTKSQLLKKITATFINLYRKFHCSASKASSILIVLHFYVADSGQNPPWASLRPLMILSSIKKALISTHWRTDLNKMQYSGEENTHQWQLFSRGLERGWRSTDALKK